MSDDLFPQFLEVLVRWARLALEFLATELDVDEAIDDAQQQIRDTDPDGLALIAFVFDL